MKGTWLYEIKKMQTFTCVPYRPTDQPTDRPTDRVSCRGASLPKIITVMMLGLEPRCTTSEEWLMIWQYKCLNQPLTPDVYVGQIIPPIIAFYALTTTLLYKYICIYLVKNCLLYTFIGQIWQCNINQNITCRE